MDNVNLKNRIAKLIQAKGWTEAETAMHSETTQSTIHRIVSGSITSPRLSTLTRIAKALGVSVYDLTSPDQDLTLVMEEGAVYNTKCGPEYETIKLLKTKNLNTSDYQALNMLIKHLDKKNQLN